jgi:hypothetical protein
MEQLSKAIQAETGITFLGGTFLFAYTEEGVKKYMAATMQSGSRIIVRTLDSDLDDFNECLDRGSDQLAAWYQTYPSDGGTA